MHEHETELPPNGHISYFELVQSEVVEDEFMRARAYWKTEDEDHPVSEWQAEVVSGETMMGYWEWVRSLRASLRLSQLAEERAA